MLSIKEKNKILASFVKGIFPYRRKNKEQIFFYKKDIKWEMIYIVHKIDSFVDVIVSSVSINEKLNVCITAYGMENREFSLMRPDVSKEIRKYLKDVKKHLQEYYKRIYIKNKRVYIS